MRRKALILVAILILAIILRVYAFSQITEPNRFTWIGGDPAHYYETASNIYDGKGPVINFIFQFWERVPLGSNDALYEPFLPYNLAALFFLFGPSIFLGKLLIFFFSLASIPLIYFIGKVVYNENAGLIASFLLAIQPKHVEYSVTIFKDNIYIFFFLLALLFLFLAFKRDKLIHWVLLGVFLAFAFLTRYLTIILIPTIIVILILNKKKVNWKRALVSLLIFLVILLPWGIYTYSQFGQPFFTITKYYGFSSSGWGGMIFENGPPSVEGYLRENSFSDIITTRLSLIPLTLYNLPIWFNPFILIFALLTLLLKDDYSRNLKIYFLIFFASFIIQFSHANIFGERAFFSIIYASLVPTGFIISRIPIFIKKNKIRVNYRIIVAAVLIVLAISSLALLQWKLEELKSYGMQEKQEDLERLGNWVGSNVEESAIIMTTKPSDVHFYTKRRTVADPYNFAINQRADIEKYLDRSKEEVSNYNVTYVLIHTKDASALEGFKDFNLDLVYSDEGAELFLYRIRELS